MKPRAVRSEKARGELEKLFTKHALRDFQWIDPKEIVVSQWVRMKCTFGCGNYGKNACCPPNVPTVAECERFFRDYSEAAVFHLERKVEKPQDRHKWGQGINARLSKLERDVFLAGYERAFLLFMSPCGLCGECSGDRGACKNPRISRPTPEALAIDVYSTVRVLGYPIQVLSNYDQEMNRYAFLMVR
jgi:predicted metal-binding protein